MKFDAARDLLFRRDTMIPPGAKMQHPNGLRLTAFDAGGAPLDRRIYFSIGGGFIVEDGVDPQTSVQNEKKVPFPFHSAAELLATAHANELSISQLMLENECALVRKEDAEESGRARVEVVRDRIDGLWQVMQACVQRGMETEGILPGGLQVRRRARRLAERLREK